MMGSLRCKQHFSSSMYHNSNINNNNNNKNSNNKKISNIKISNNNIIINNKNYEKKNYNCFPSEPSKPNFPALLPSAATLTATTDDRPNLRLRRPDAFLLLLSSSTAVSLPGHDWCPPLPAQDRVHVPLDQPSSDSFGSH